METDNRVCDYLPTFHSAQENAVEVHGTQVFYKSTGSTHWRLVGSCTSLQAAQAIARLLKS